MIKVCNHYKLPLALLLILLTSCGSKQKPAISVYALKEMSDLATVEYTVSKVIKASDNQTWFKVGERKILMKCEATIKAGIDMSKLQQEDFTIEGRNVSVKLPAPEIISFSIPPESIRTEFEETGFFRNKFTAREKNALAIQAEKQIRLGLDSLGILTQAKASTGLFVHNFLKKLGYENISVSYETEGGTLQK